MTKMRGAVLGRRQRLWLILVESENVPPGYPQGQTDYGRINQLVSVCRLCVRRSILKKDKFIITKIPEAGWSLSSQLI